MTQEQANLLWSSIADDFEYNGYTRTADFLRKATDSAKLDMAEIIRKNVIWFEGKRRKKEPRSIFAE